MNDMKPSEVLYNAFIACGMKPERETKDGYDYIIHDVFVYVFDKSTGKHIETCVKKHYAVNVIKI